MEGRQLRRPQLHTKDYGKWRRTENRRNALSQSGAHTSCPPNTKRSALNILCTEPVIFIYLRGKKSTKKKRAVNLKEVGVALWVLMEKREKGNNYNLIK